ncbi:HAMP domain-containing sensor histidine kinase [Mycobacterium sp. AZCC_0083]|uniref:sensor histidine kinase n=1 Tax=Mycobacterium sp. AZCC_0083 TaxID=2735882 RepID=UPI00162072E7|nr:HAMP domain-containing sensor histidine kinase [Mycobacterium sp. AZCC_0083]MBB5168347.1 signal transduction histidine kinase [Mycobacterium sp. AZCC_0083]
MGLRVRAVLVALLLLAVVALAVPLALSLADRKTAALAAERDRQLAALADAAASPDTPLQRLVDRYDEVYGEGLLITDSDGHALASRGLDVSDPGVTTAIIHALVDAPASQWDPVLPWHRDRLLATTGVRRDGELVGAVVLAVDPKVAARNVAVGWLWVAVGCLLLLVLAVVVGRSLTRWVLRPLDGLERAVAEMTEGIAGPPADVAGPPEVRHFTAAFNTMAQVVRASLDHQRRLIADASHQLRNPLAAVRLRADTLENYLIEDGWPTYHALSAELDRFENLLGQLLRLARAEQVSGSRQVGLATTAAESADLADVIAERVAYWQPILDSADQLLDNRSNQRGPVVQLARHDVEQLLDVALENALRYAGSGATVTVSTAQGGETAELIVSDNGTGLPDEDLAHAATRFWRAQNDGAGTGLGLAIAAEITAGHGGTISVEKAPEGGVLVRYRLPVTGEP